MFMGSDGIFHPHFYNEFFLSDSKQMYKIKSKNKNFTDLFFTIFWKNVQKK